MARQRIHNSRAGRGTGNSGASWISYSDMMAALVLVFVLILSYSLYQYFSMLESKEAELNSKEALILQQQQQADEDAQRIAAQLIILGEKDAELSAAQTALDEQTAALIIAQTTLDDQRLKLDAANSTLALQQDELEALRIDLANKQIALDAATSVLDQQRKELAAQTQRIDNIVGMRTQIVQDLSTTLSAKKIGVTVDPQTGDIKMDSSSVSFEFNSYNLTPESKATLDRFVPVYLEVLLRPEYQDYLGEIIIEGHTDSTGSFISNLKLSQNRALAVVEYCLNMPGLTSAQRSLLQKIITPKGRSFSDPIYYSNGTINEDASRRVEFKFSLKDAEMIAEMNRLLQQQDAQNQRSN